MRKGTIWAAEELAYFNNKQNPSTWVKKYVVKYNYKMLVLAYLLYINRMLNYDNLN